MVLEAGERHVWRSTHPDGLQLSLSDPTGKSSETWIDFFERAGKNISNICWPLLMECVAVALKMEEGRCARSCTYVILEFQAGGGARELRFNRGSEKLFFPTSWQCAGKGRRHNFMPFLLAPHLSIRLPSYRRHSPSNDCSGWSDDLLTASIWWSSPAESHLMESPRNGNNFQANFTDN